MSIIEKLAERLGVSFESYSPDAALLEVANGSQDTPWSMLLDREEVFALAAELFRIAASMPKPGDEE